MLDSFLKLVLLPLLVSVVAELIAEWLICKWQNNCDNQSFIFPFITSTKEETSFPYFQLQTLHWIV